MNTVWIAAHKKASKGTFSKMVIRLVILLTLFRHNYDLVFGFSMLGMDKAHRLVYGESLMTHAMTLTGLSFQVSAVINPLVTAPLKVGKNS